MIAVNQDSFVDSPFIPQTPVVTCFKKCIPVRNKD